MNDRDFVIISLIAFGLVVFDWGVFAITCIIGRRPDARRNVWAGIRILSTMVSDEAWRAAHAAAFITSN